MGVDLAQGLRKVLGEIRVDLGVDEDVVVGPVRVLRQIDDPQALLDLAGRVVDPVTELWRSRRRG